MQNSLTPSSRSVSTLRWVASAAFWLVLLHFAAFLIEHGSIRLLERGASHIAGGFSMCPDLTFRHGQLWRLVSGVYFVQASFGQVIWLAIFLWTFGRWHEERYGAIELLVHYHAAGAFACLVWGVSNVWGTLAPQELGWQTSLRTFAAIASLMTVVVVRGPSRLLTVFGILPIPAWALAVGYFGGALALFTEAPTALPFPAILGGVVFGLLYQQYDMTIGAAIERWRERRLAHRDQSAPQASGAGVSSAGIAESAVSALSDDELRRRVDRALERISRSGADSLSNEDRRLLEEASRRFRDTPR